MAAVLGGLLLVLIVGGTRLGWRWTGFGDNDHLWDYLKLLVLPVVLALLPVWHRTHVRLDRVWRAGLSLLGVVFAVLVVGGYRLGWDWTGFRGNKLWDWLQLLVLPVTLALLPKLLLASSRLGRWQRHAVLASVLLFGVLVLGGYDLHWDWTGFAGNTVWDWLQLLLVPFVLPAALTIFLREEAEVAAGNEAGHSPRGPAGRPPLR